MGRNPAVQLGKTDDEIWPPDVAAGLREHDRAVLESGRPLEVVEVVPAPDGSPQHWLAFKFPFQDSAGALLLGGVSVNITERVRAEAKLRALSNRLVEVQEEERRALARELHDELGQSLTALRFTVEQLGALVGDDARPRAAEARAAIEEMLARVRDLSSDLRPPLLDHVGLAPALGSLVERYTARTGIRVGFRHTGLGRRFDLHVETAAYRIVQEALTNVGRHARVTEAAVRVWADADCLAAQIEDHGVGFDPAAVATSGRSCGLAGMAERARLLGGELAIESNPGSGTHVFARLPIRPPPDTRRGGGRGEEGPAAS
jgi:signal transduction histidine kinase